MIKLNEVTFKVDASADGRFVFASEVFVRRETAPLSRGERAPPLKRETGPPLHNLLLMSLHYYEKLIAEKTFWDI